MKWAVVLVVVGAFGIIAFGQEKTDTAQPVSAEEAMRRLHERQAARKGGAATEPAQVEQLSVAQRVAAIEDLKKRIAGVGSEIARAQDEAFKHAGTTPAYSKAQKDLDQAIQRLNAMPVSASREERENAIEAVERTKNGSRAVLVQVTERDPNVMQLSDRLRGLWRRLEVLRTVDLLDGVIRPNQIARSGAWSFRGNGLVGTSKEEPAAIRFPLAMPTKYALQLIHKRGVISGWIELGFPVGDRAALVSIVDPRILGTARLSVYVNPEGRDGAVRVRADGRFLEETNLIKLSWDRLPTALEEGPKNTVGLTFNDGAAEFSSITVLPCDTDDELSRKMEDDGNLPILPSPAAQEDRPSPGAGRLLLTPAGRTEDHPVIPTIVPGRPIGVPR